MARVFRTADFLGSVKLFQQAAETPEFVTGVARCVSWSRGGNDQQQGDVFSYISPEQRVRKDRRLRPIRTMVDKILKERSPEFDYNILFRWFVALDLDDAVWDAAVFTKNRDRLLEAEVAKEFLALVVAQARG
jgi:hypothetical protein